MEYRQCGGTYFNFFNNTIITDQVTDEGMLLNIPCSEMLIQIAKSSFETKLRLLFSTLPINAVLVDDNLFAGHLDVLWYNESHISCSPGLTFRRNNFDLGFSIRSNVRDCTILTIEDSYVSSSSTILLETGTMNDMTTIQAFFDNVKIANSHDDIGIPVLLVREVVIMFKNYCAFENNSKSALQAVGSKVIFQGENAFKDNSALFGAGLQLIQNSIMYFEQDTSVLFEDNHAEYVGGAIYTDSKPSDPCFFNRTLLTDNIETDFIGNSAVLAGSSMYGDFSSCCESDTSCDLFFDVFQIQNTEEDPSAIASSPDSVCLCEANHSQPNCSVFNSYHHNTDAYPGQEFTVRLAVVGG